MNKDYQYLLDTADFCCDLGLPDDETLTTKLLQNDAGGKQDDYKLTICLEGITRAQVRAIMTIIDALNVNDKIV
jgi:hypothetical protein